MEHFDSPGRPSESSQSSESGQLTEAERQAIRQRAAQARVAASEAVAHYAVLMDQARGHVDVLARKRVAIDALREMLRQSVTRYAVLLKTLDTPPERTLSLVKQAVAEQMAHPEFEPETGALMQDVVTWCIAAYYNSSPAA